MIWTNLRINFVLIIRIWLRLRSVLRGSVVTTGEGRHDRAPPVAWNGLTSFPNPRSFRTSRTFEYQKVLRFQLSCNNVPFQPF